MEYAGSGQPASVGDPANRRIGNPGYKRRAMGGD